jgi:hypothetical protein
MSIPPPLGIAISFERVPCNPTEEKRHDAVHRHTPSTDFATAMGILETPHKVIVPLKTTKIPTPHLNQQADAA